jgi:hypothetical protein
MQYPGSVPSDYVASSRQRHCSRLSRWQRAKRVNICPSQSYLLAGNTSDILWFLDCAFSFARRGPPVNCWRMLLDAVLLDNQEVGLGCHMPRWTTACAYKLGRGCGNTKKWVVEDAPLSSFSCIQPCGGQLEFMPCDLLNTPRSLQLLQHDSKVLGTCSQIPWFLPLTTMHLGQATPGPGAFSSPPHPQLNVESESTLNSSGRTLHCCAYAFRTRETIRVRLKLVIETPLTIQCLTSPDMQYRRSHSVPL